LKFCRIVLEQLVSGAGGWHENVPQLRDTATGGRLGPGSSAAARDYQQQLMHLGERWLPMASDGNSSYQLCMGSSVWLYTGVVVVSGVQQRSTTSCGMATACISVAQQLVWAAVHAAAFAAFPCYLMCIKLAEMACRPPLHPPPFWCTCQKHWKTQRNTVQFVLEARPRISITIQH
jgi:hypothetical protein